MFLTNWLILLVLDIPTILLLALARLERITWHSYNCILIILLFLSKTLNKKGKVYVRGADVFVHSLSYFERSDPANFCVRRSPGEWSGFSTSWLLHSARGFTPKNYASLRDGNGPSVLHWDSSLYVCLTLVEEKGDPKAAVIGASRRLCARRISAKFWRYRGLYLVVLVVVK